MSPDGLCPQLKSVEVGAGEYGKAALRAVELQRSSEEDPDNAALRLQTEQRTLSLLQVCCAIPYSPPCMTSLRHAEIPHQHLLGFRV